MIWSPYRVFEGELRRAHEARVSMLTLHRSEILMGLEALKANPLLAPYGRKKDAGPTLNPQVSWNGVEGAKPAPLSAPAKVSEAYRKFIRTAWSEDLLKQVDLTGVDFTWMKKLAEFDHWDLDEYAVALMPEADRMTLKVLGERPSPKGEDLIAWAWARLIQGAQSGTESEAFAEVFQLLRLMYSSEDFDLVLRVGAMGSTVLGRAYEFLEARKRDLAPSLSQFIAADWRGLANSRVYLFLVSNLGSYVGPMTPVDLTAEVRAKVPSLYCKALSESLVSDAIERSIYIEASTKERQEQFRKFLPTVQECRLTLIRRLWQDEKFERSLYEGFLEEWYRKALSGMDRMWVRSEYQRIQVLTAARWVEAQKFFEQKPLKDSDRFESHVPSPSPSPSGAPI